jgi:hypothetical protein
MIKDAYPPLREFLVQLREDLAVQKAWLEVLEGRLEVCEELTIELLKEKEYADNWKTGGAKADH